MPKKLTASRQQQAIRKIFVKRTHERTYCQNE
jgi:hypothetical protein